MESTLLLYSESLYNKAWIHRKVYLISHFLLQPKFQTQVLELPLAHKNNQEKEEEKGFIWEGIVVYM